MQESPKGFTFYCKIKGSLKRFVDVIYSVTEFKRKAFVLSVKVLSPYEIFLRKTEEGA